MCVYISTEFIMLLIFIVGLVVGWIVHKIIAAPQEPIDYYDGTHGMGYSPRPNKDNSELKNPPKSRMPTSNFKAVACSGRNNCKLVTVPKGYYGQAYCELCQRHPPMPPLKKPKK